MPKPDEAGERSLEQWQVEEIRRALREADRGEFASTQDVARIFKKWRRRST